MVPAWVVGLITLQLQLQLNEPGAGALELVAASRKNVGTPLGGVMAQAVDCAKTCASSVPMSCG